MSQQLEANAENPPARTAELELSVSGMTCGSCAARVEKVLNRQAGVERAGVNFSTERATVVFDPDVVGVEDLVGAVGKIGYGLPPQVGIDRVLAEVLPADKVEEVRRLQDDGRVVAMVGDGINDAPALVQAELGIAIGSGTDVAIESSDITLLSGDLGVVASAMRLSRRTFRTILQNLGWAFGYNPAASPWPWSAPSNPSNAGAAMAFSSVSVASNSLRVYRFRRA